MSTPRRTDSVFCHVIGITQNKDSHWTEIISGATCVLYHSGTVKAGATNIPQGGHASYIRRTSVVTPSLSDFVIDVQNTARRVLSPSDGAYFMEVYFRHFIPVADEAEPSDWTLDGKDKYFVQFLDTLPLRSRPTVEERDCRIRAALGAAFEERGIYPFHRYMNQQRKDSHRPIVKEVAA